MFPAVSVCRTWIDLLPSPALRFQLVNEKEPAVQVVVCPATTSPVNDTVNPLSQFPDNAVVAADVRKDVDAAGVEIVSVGAVVSTVNVVLTDVAREAFPTASLAAPAGIEIPTVPFPVQPERTTVAEVRPETVTELVQVAPPVVCSETALKGTADTPFVSVKFTL